MRLPFLKKKSKESDRLKEELHGKLNDVHDRLEKVLVKLRKVNKVVVNEPAKLRVVK